MSIPKPVRSWYFAGTFTLGLGIICALTGKAVPELAYCYLAFEVLAIFLIGKGTFDWATTRGFPARNSFGQINFVNIARSLTMTLLAFVCACLIAGAPAATILVLSQTFHS